MHNATEDSVLRSLSKILRRFISIHQDGPQKAAETSLGSAKKALERSETETIRKKASERWCEGNRADSQGKMQEHRSIGGELIFSPATHGG